MLKKAARDVLALLPCSRTMSTLRASKGLRPCWIDPSERLRACFFEHSLPLTMRGSFGAFIGCWSAIFNRPFKEFQNQETAVGNFRLQKLRFSHKGQNQWKCLLRSRLDTERLGMAIGHELRELRLYTGRSIEGMFKKVRPARPQPF